jgi:hypothetical protein
MHLFTNDISKEIYITRYDVQRRHLIALEEVQKDAVVAYC